MFDIDQTGAILGTVGSGRDVLRPTKGLIRSDPDLPHVDSGRSADVGRRRPSQPQKVEVSTFIHHCHELGATASLALALQRPCPKRDCGYSLLVLPSSPVLYGAKTPLTSHQRYVYPTGRADAPCLLSCNEIINTGNDMMGEGVCRRKVSLAPTFIVF